MVLEAVDVKLGKKVAIKIDAPTKNRRPKFLREKNILDHLMEEGCTVVPQIHSYGNDMDITGIGMGRQGYTVMEKEGPDLGILREKVGKLPVKTILWMAEELILNYEKLHDTEVLHRDAKPQNYCVSLSRPNTCKIIDFGLAIWYRDEHGRHLPYTKSNKPVGTARYASLNVHRGRSQSRRDDLESLGYVLVYLFLGSLPWQGD